jgi:hypothetical protein
MVHYRALFEELLADSGGAVTGDQSPRHADAGHQEPINDDERAARRDAQGR